MEDNMGSETYITHNGENFPLLSRKMFLYANKNGGFNVGNEEERQQTQPTASSNSKIASELEIYKRPQIISKIHRFIQRNWFNFLFFGMCTLICIGCLHWAMKNDYDYSFWKKLLALFENGTTNVVNFKFAVLVFIVLLGIGIYITLQIMMPFSRLPTKWRNYILQYKWIRLLNKLNYIQTHEMGLDNPNMDINDPRCERGNKKIEGLINEFICDSNKITMGNTEELKSICDTIGAGRHYGKYPFALRGRKLFLPMIVKQGHSSPINAT